MAKQRERERVSTWLISEHVHWHRAQSQVTEIMIWSKTKSQTLHWVTHHCAPSSGAQSLLGLGNVGPADTSAFLPSQSHGWVSILHSSFLTGLLPKSIFLLLKGQLPSTSFTPPRDMETQISWTLPWTPALACFVSICKTPDYWPMRLLPDTHLTAIHLELTVPGVPLVLQISVGFHFSLFCTPQSILSIVFQFHVLLFSCVFSQMKQVLAFCCIKDLFIYLYYV